MIIEKKKISDLKLAPYNPRKSNEKQEANLKKSLEKFGVVEPIVFNKQTGYIVGGHFRIRELKKLGYKEVDCVIVDLNEDDEKELNIRLNANTGEWDWEMLQADWDIEELESWGLDIPEWENEEVLEVEEDDFDTTPPEIPITVLGDLYEIGEHRLLCGDSTNVDDVTKLMNGEKADIMVSDPPYGIDLDTDYSKMGATTTKYEKIKGDDKEFDLTDVISISGTKEQYIWGGDYFVNSLDWMSGTQIIWAKRHSEEENKVFGSAFESLWVSYKCKKLIWFIRPINQSSERLGKHPTQKPIECMSRCIEMSKLKGVVYDAFLGSGSTMAASHQLKRKCYGMELDPKYCDVIVKRMIALDSNLKIKLNGKEIEHSYFD